MNDQTPITHLNPVAALRAQLGLTLAEFGERIDLSKSQMHEVERTGRASLAVALRIEALAADVPGCAIDAADLSDDVRNARLGVGARAGVGVAHGMGNNTDAALPSTGQAGELSGGVGL